MHPTELLAYVAKPDNALHCETVGDSRRNNVAIREMRLTSQEWKGRLWRHQFVWFAPDEPAFFDIALIFVEADGWATNDFQFGALVAESLAIPCAFLHDIPNQPLFDGDIEDGLIAYTLQQYLDTGDAEWPLLFPMVKSVVRAMDAIQAQNPQITRFIVGGMSKRGWTSWLTAAVDRRVAGIIPIVYDNLNLFAQMAHQVEMWGGFSEQIADYTERDLQAQMATPAGQHLAAMIDPYSYLERLTLPKLIVNGSNDPYWTTDALNLYWNDLSGPKNVLIQPNGRHNFGDSERVLSTATAFVHAVATGSTLPALRWEVTPNGDTLSIAIAADAPGTMARVWQAHSPTLDFREAVWLKASLVNATGSETALVFTGDIALPETGHIALFGEVAFRAEGRTYTLSTPPFVR